MQEQNTYVGTSFSRRNVLGRILWAIVGGIFFRYSPRPLHSWRIFLLRCFGAKVGKGVLIFPLVKVWAPWNLELRYECVIANRVNLYSQGKITIGCQAIISQGTHICAGTHDYNKSDFPLITSPILIDDQAWIAAEAFIHPGVTIGKGAVVGARSVVTKDMPEWMVCAGHPCKPIKPRDLAFKKDFSHIQQQ